MVSVVDFSQTGVLITTASAWFWSGSCLITTASAWFWSGSRLITTASAWFCIRQPPDHYCLCLILIRQPPDQSGSCLILNRQPPDQSGSCQILTRQILLRHITLLPQPISIWQLPDCSCSILPLLVRSGRSQYQPGVTNRRVESTVLGGSKVE